MVLTFPLGFITIPSSHQSKGFLFMPVLDIFYSTSYCKGTQELKHSCTEMYTLETGVEGNRG